jgi:MurNAc alpha-1-phosphate uridylyltransferase
MKAPTKALVLAAGFGTRLLPLTRETPKPLLPIWNVSNLERVLAMLRGWGVRDVLINLHHRADRLFEHVRTRGQPDGLAHRAFL